MDVHQAPAPRPGVLRGFTGPARSRRTRSSPRGVLRLRSPRVPGPPRGRPRGPRVGVAHLLTRRWTSAPEADCARPRRRRGGPVTAADAGGGGGTHSPRTFEPDTPRRDAARAGGIKPARRPGTAAKPSTTTRPGATSRAAPRPRELRAADAIRSSSSSREEAAWGAATRSLDARGAVWAARRCSPLALLSMGRTRTRSTARRGAVTIGERGRWRHRGARRRMDAARRRSPRRHACRSRQSATTLGLAGRSEARETPRRVGGGRN